MTTSTTPAREGMVVAIRNRRARITGAKPFTTATGVRSDYRDRLAPDGAWCLWNDLKDRHAAAAASGERGVVPVPACVGAEFGAFTFNRLSPVPVNTGPEHLAIPMPEGEDDDMLARLVDVVKHELFPELFPFVSAPEVEG
jgi:hypothetical protein